MSEVTITDRIRVEASARRVWDAIKDPREHAGWHPFVTQINGEHDIDELRTCSVIVGRKSGTTKERCTEYREQRAIRWAIQEDTTGFSKIVSDWRAGFELEPVDGATGITAESTFKPNNVLVRLMTPLLRRKFHQAQRAILEGLRASLETDGSGTVT
jgi:hypothetical protein